MYYELVGLNTRILGTIHLLPPCAGDLPPWVSSAFNWAERIDQETGPDDALNHGHHADGSLKPWAAFFRRLREGYAALPTEPGIERRLASRLEAERGRAMGSLETGAELARLLDRVPQGDIDAAFAAADAYDSSKADTLKRLHSAWENCSFNELQAIATDSPIGSAPGMREAFFSARNRAWAKALCRAQQTKERRLVLVGALHLVGAGNLLQFIEQRGRRLVNLLQNPATYIG